MFFYLKSYFLKTFLFLLTGYLLGACASGCFEGDDFGGLLTASVDSLRSEGSIDFKDSNMTGDGSQDPTNHVIRWQDTRYITDGNPIVFTIKGGWCPFYECAEDDNYNIEEFDKVTVKSSTELVQSCPAPPGFQKNFVDGSGLYMLLRDPNTEPDPNESIDTMRNPRSANIHVYAGVTGTGESAKYSSNNAMPKNPFGEPLVLEKGMEVYFKILDSHYYDNSGGYEIKFFSGVVDPKRIYPYEILRKTIEQFFTQSAYDMFSNLINTDYYKQLVIFALALQLFFAAGAFLFGITNVSFGELAIRMFKFIMVAALISPEAWTFFNNILFGALIGVPKQLISLAASGEYDADAPFKFLDEIVWYKIFSSVVWEVKLNALFICSTIKGLLWILCFILLAVLFLFFATSAVFRYMMCMIAISFLIAVFPIILIGSLFSQLKSSFESWIKQSLSYVLQGFMAFIIVIFFADLVLDEMYRTIGFKACKTNIFIIGFNIYGNADKGEEDSYVLGVSVPGFVPGNPKLFRPVKLVNLVKIGSGKRYVFDEILDTIPVPPEYKKNDFRYTELPFLDPNINSESPENPDDWAKDPSITNQRDHQRIVGVIREGDLVDLQEMLVLLLTVLILISLKDAILAVAQFIAVGGMSWSPTVGGLFEGAYTNIQHTLAKQDFEPFKKAGQLMSLPDAARHMIGSKIDKIDNITSKPINSIPFAGSIFSGSNLSTREMADRMVQDSKNFKALHLYQDVVGGNVQWASSKVKGASKAMITAGMVEPMTSVSGIVKGAKMIERFGSGEKDAKGVLKSLGKGISSSVNARADIKDDYSDYMDKSLALYYLKDDEKTIEKAIKDKTSSKSQPAGGLPNGKPNLSESEHSTRTSIEGAVGTSYDGIKDLDANESPGGKYKFEDDGTDRDTMSFSLNYGEGPERTAALHDANQDLTSVNPNVDNEQTIEKPIDTGSGSEEGSSLFAATVAANKKEEGAKKDKDSSEIKEKGAEKSYADESKSVDKKQEKLTKEEKEESKKTESLEQSLSNRIQNLETKRKNASTLEERERILKEINELQSKLDNN